MKKLSILFFLMVLPMVVESLFAAVHIGNIKVPEYACGTIYFNDGREETYKWVEIPTKGQDKIGVSNEDNKSKKEHFESKDIRCITFWNENFPEKTTTIFQIKFIYDWGKKEREWNAWGLELQENSWGRMYICYSEYGINKKTGDLETYTITVNNVPDDPMIFIESRDFQDARFVGRYTRHKDRKTGVEKRGVYGWLKKSLKTIASYFSSKPDVAEQIANGTLTGYDLFYIFDQMGAE